MPRKSATSPGKSTRRAKPTAATKKKADVVVYGATGYTGGLAARAMERAGLSMVLAGRNRERLERLASEFDDEHPIAVARHDDPEALLELASSGSVLVSTAGPFSEVGELVVAAAVKTGSSYLDSTGDGDFMARTHRRHDDEARAKGIVVVNSCAFEYLLGDCAVALAMVKAERPLEVRVSYWIPKKAMTHGTALSANGAMFSRQADGGLFRSHQVDFPGVGRRWAVTYPGGEREFMRRRSPGIKTTTLMDMPALLARSAGLMPRVGPLLSFGPVKALMEAAVRRMPAGPTDEERATQEFMILVEVDPGTKRRSGVVVRGRDPYGLTGEILARSAARIVGGKTLASGVLAPSEAFESRDALDSLADLDVSWERF
jgi:short subunit dehydrogenase-like uncharacterized protein